MKLFVLNSSPQQRIKSGVNTELKTTLLKLLSKAKTTLENYAAFYAAMGETEDNILWGQGNWEETFITMSLAYFQPEKAIELFERSFLGQLENGMLPQFGRAKTSNLVRVPIQGYLLWQIYSLINDQRKGKAFLKKNYPKVLAFHRFLYTHRDPQGEGIVYIQDPTESGMGTAPTWDDFLPDKDSDNLMKAPENEQNETGPFAVQDPFFNSLLVWSNESLIKAGSALKEDVLEIIQWHELSIYSLNDKLWDEERGIYNVYDLNTACMLPVSSIGGLLPLLGEVPTQDQAEGVLNTLESAMFGGKSEEYYFCPTNSLNTDTISFSEKWRGAVSSLSNWMLIQGLKRYDMDEMAEKVKKDMLELFSKFGFFEYYDARRMEAHSRGYGQKEDPVAAAICIDLLMREVDVLMV